MQEVFEKIIEKLERLKTPCELGMIENGRYILRDEAIEIVKQAAAEHNNGWIPCSGCADCNHKECEHYGKVLRPYWNEVWKTNCFRNVRKR